MDSGSGACSQPSASWLLPLLYSSGLCPPTTPQIPLHTLIFLPWILLAFQFVQTLFLDSYGQMTPHPEITVGGDVLTVRTPAVSAPCYLGGGVDTCYTPSCSYTVLETLNKCFRDRCNF